MLTLTANSLKTSSTEQPSQVCVARSLFLRENPNSKLFGNSFLKIEPRQDKDRRTRPRHRAGPQSPATQSPATEYTEFMGAARGQERDKRSARGGQDPDAEPGHRVQGHHGQDKDKEDKPQSPAAEFRGAASECGQLCLF